MAIRRRLHGAGRDANLPGVSDTINELDPVAVRRQGERRARAPAEVCYVQARCAETLSERLDWLAAKPRTVLDLSADGGQAAAAALGRCRGARLLRTGAAALGPDRRRWWQRGGEQRCPDIAAVPAGSAELALASLTLPWIGEPDDWFADLARVLAPDAPLLLATLGPDSFRELRAAWAAAGRTGQVPVFADMHDIGDALVRAGFVEPVLDADRLTISFATPAALWRDLRLAGAGNVLADRPRGLAGRNCFAAAGAALEAAGPGTAITLELVFAHAFAPRQRVAGGAGEFAIDALSIGRRRP